MHSFHCDRPQWAILVRSFASQLNSDLRQTNSIESHIFIVINHSQHSVCGHLNGDIRAAKPHRCTPMLLHPPAIHAISMNASDALESWTIGGKWQLGSGLFHFCRCLQVSVECAKPTDLHEFSPTIRACAISIAHLHSRLRTKCNLCNNIEPVPPLFFWHCCCPWTCASISHKLPG